MEQEYPVPGFPRYTVTKDGKVYSYCGNGNRRLLRPAWRIKKSTSRKTGNFRLAHKNEHGETVYKNCAYHRLVLSAKIGRQLEDWEHCRHIDGNPNNNCMDNLQVGCVLLNAIDCIENGTRQTSAAYVDQAIQRLRELRKSL